MNFKPSFVDIFGQEVTVGCIIAVAFKKHQRTEIRAGKVVDLKFQEKFTGYILEWIQVDWSLHGEPSWITKLTSDYLDQRVLVVDLPFLQQQELIERFADQNKTKNNAVTEIADYL